MYSFLAAVCFCNFLWMGLIKWYCIVLYCIVKFVCWRETPFLHILLVLCINISRKFWLWSSITFLILDRFFKFWYRFLSFSILFWMVWLFLKSKDFYFFFSWHTYPLPTLGKSSLNLQPRLLWLTISHHYLKVNYSYLVVDVLIFQKIVTSKDLTG